MQPSERKIRSRVASLNVWTACWADERMFSLFRKHFQPPTVSVAGGYHTRWVSLRLYWSGTWYISSPVLFITSVSWRIFQKPPSRSREAQQTRLMSHVYCLGHSGPFCSVTNCHRDGFILRILTKEACDLIHAQPEYCWTEATNLNRRSTDSNNSININVG